jgi:hypothetical protein
VLVVVVVVEVLVVLAIWCCGVGSSTSFCGGTITNFGGVM